MIMGVHVRNYSSDTKLFINKVALVFPFSLVKEVHARDTNITVKSFIDDTSGIIILFDGWKDILPNDSGIRILKLSGIEEVINGSPSPIKFPGTNKSIKISYMLIHGIAINVCPLYFIKVEEQDEFPDGSNDDNYLKLECLQLVTYQYWNQLLFWDGPGRSDTDKYVKLNSLCIDTVSLRGCTDNNFKFSWNKFSGYTNVRGMLQAKLVKDVNGQNAIVLNPEDLQDDKETELKSSVNAVTAAVLKCFVM